METPTSVRQALRPRDWVTSIDLSDAYFHILMHQTDRKWLRFVWGNRIFQFRALPFGLSLAPWIFTMVVRQFCALIRGQGIRLRTYLDDWLIQNQAQSLCLSHTQIVLREAAELGFRNNSTKSELTPSQNFTYLGMVFDTVEWTVQPSQRRIIKIQDQINATADLFVASVRSLTSILGQMESLAPLTHFGRLHKRPFQEALNSKWDPRSQNWETLVSLQDCFIETTRQWLVTAWLTQGVPIVLPPPSKHLFTDASLEGWGAHLDDHTTFGLWTQSQVKWHINMLELEAVFLAVMEFLPFLRGEHVLVHSDNTTVVAYLNKQGGSRSLPLSHRACEMLVWCHKHGMVLSAKYLPGKLNVLADSLSRSFKVMHSEWTITHQALLRLWAQVEKPPIDLFATRFSRRLPIFVSPFPDPEAWEVNALEIPWNNLQAYAFPPIPLLARVLRKADLERPSLILVAPNWPSQAWYPDLLRLSSGPPLPLDLRRGELVQPRSGIPHDNPQWLALHGWPLCGSH
ncbi:hypothetical protein V1264_017305 [Littorina saxatilis]|uniref:Reverse transcriptase domain-containing protein n=1 Tax=Littorina saxatilis TaxID=31220 RepID=A0AAN9BH45_9CAEN